MNVELRIEPGSYMPVHAQLKEQIRFLILHGELRPGARLPTAQQLAGFLRVNRNTVLKAYQALAQEGLVECRRGRGCVVLEPPAALARPVPDGLLALVDGAIEQASQLGVTPDDFATLSYARARQRRDVHLKRRLAFVECEEPIARTLARILQEKTGVEVVPVVLRDLQRPTPELDAAMREAQVVATTFFHIQEVRQLLVKRKKEVVGLGVKPHLENLIQIAGIPRGTPTALVCISQLCAEELKQSLEDAGIRGLETVLAGTDDMPRLRDTLSGVAKVIASDFVAAEVRPLLEKGQELIVLDYSTMDAGAINLLKSLMNEGGPAT